MGEPFLGELRLLSFNFPPRGWAQCAGQLLPINANQALFSLLGTMYGGDGRVNFALPDLRGRVPVHLGGPLGFIQGQRFGEEAHVLQVGEMPEHTHGLNVSTAAGDTAAAGVLANVENTYRPPANLTALHPQSLASVGSGAAHENRPPSLALEWCIALQGIFPSQS
jgi:microcystin-dependent protein